MKRPAIAIILLVTAVVIGIVVWRGRNGRVIRHRTSNLPNILLVTFDTTRMDHLSCYGYRRETSPRIDALAAEGVLFERCIATSSWTLPAHASLLTGRYPTSHGAIYDPKGDSVLTGVLPGEWSNYRVSALSEKIQTLATVLKKNGYVTGGVVGGPWMKKPFGLGQGFDYYDDDEIIEVRGRLAEQVNARALAWIDKVAERPFLLFLNYFDPHDPYMAPGDYRFRFVDMSTLIHGAKATPEQLVAFYDAEIYYADHCLGLVIDRIRDLGLYDDTWIIITADHGELFGEHDMRGHGSTLYEPELRIPLVMKYPKRWAQQGRVAEPIQLTDIMPIILDTLGFDGPPNMQGAPSGPLRQKLFAEVYTLSFISKLGHHRAYYEGDLKYIWNSRGRHMLFDLRSDPHEENNLYATHVERALELRESMDALVKALPRPGESTIVTKIDQETMQVLKTLGYVNPGGSATTTKATTTGTAPAGP